jgi:uncharacterized Zn finger protein
VKCPKCGGSQMRGPRYVKKLGSGLPGTMSESLNYSCTTCGYVHSEPCKDSEQTESKKYLREG